MSPVVYQAPVGETREEVLADGTKLTLNSRSSAQVWMDAKSRRVRIDGEAHLSVVHDRSRPFLVCGAGRLFVDTGTAFNVLALSSASIVVTVAEGEVRPAGDCGSSGDFSPPGKRSWYEIWDRDEPLGPPIAARQQITVTRVPGGVAEVRKDLTDLELDDIGAWQRGQIVFRDAALPEVVATLNRYFPQQLRIADQSLVNDRVRMTFLYQDFNIEAIVTALQRSDKDDEIASRSDAAHPDVIELVRKPQEAGVAAGPWAGRD